MPGFMFFLDPVEPATPAYARFAAIGALIFTFIGAGWVIASLMNWPATQPWVYALVAAPVIALTGLAVVRIITASRLPQVRDPALAAARGRRMGIAFGIIFTVEAALIAASAIALDSVGRSLLIPVAVAFIVGLHFLPLAWVFRLPLYYVTGLLCVACALASLLVSSETARLLALGLAMGLVLWASAVVVLVRYASPSGG